MTVQDVWGKLSVNPKTNKPYITIENFACIMQNDEHYNSVRYNEMSGRAEIHRVTEDGKPDIKPWSDADEAASRQYIESAYGLYNVGKHDDALRILFQSRRYNPVIEIVDSLFWDGTERCCNFLHEWAKVPDTPYTREVSRLIFAGGIHRLYAPGTKFDDVPILIGTRQGEGKSTLIRYLAIHDDYYGEVSQMEGQPSIEQLQGKWICEISELLALKKTKDQEAVKAYITRQVDSYRKPYDKNTTDLPRRCIFIATSNDSSPLSDKSGNRRWYPVEVGCNGYDICDHEAEIRDYILQCWAEARDKYNAGKMPNFADRKFVDLYRQAQEAAMQDDWRVGAIVSFLEKKAKGERTCVRELCHLALSPNPDFPRDPGLIESKDIGMIMNRLPDWKRLNGSVQVGKYGKQRAWEKIESTVLDPHEADQDGLPF